METASEHTPAAPRSRDPGAAELSIAEARRRTGLSRDSLLAAVNEGRLRGRWGRRNDAGQRGTGIHGSATHWWVRADDLDAFYEALPECRYPGCTRKAAAPSGCCSGPHATALRRLGKPRPPETIAKMRESTLGKPRGPHSPERRAAIAAGHLRFWSSDRSRAQRDSARKRMSDPIVQSTCQVIRWGKHGNGYAAGAVRRLEQALRRRRGGAPPKTELHARWLAMFDGRDQELEELLTADGMSRLRGIAWLDWQRHPEDWPRHNWPSARSDPDDIDPALLTGAKSRVKKALQRAGTKLTVP
jgi:hypothetical protein